MLYTNDELISEPHTLITHPVCTTTGHLIIPLHGLPDAVIIRLLVGIITDELQLKRLISPEPELRIIPDEDAPLKNTIDPLNTSPVPLTNDETTFTVRFMLPVLPDESVCVYVSV